MEQSTIKTVKIAASRIGHTPAPREADPYDGAFTMEGAREHAYANLKRTLNSYRMAGEAGADAVVSIENVMALGSYVALEKHDLFMRLIEEIPGPASDKVAQVSRAYGMYTATNFYEREGNTCYNTTVLIGRDGNIIGKYRKIHMPASENWYATPGAEYPVFDTDIGRIGLSICHDIAFPEQCRILALNGADIVLHATGGWGFVTNDGALGLELLQVRAAENCVYLANAYSFNRLRPGSSSCVISNRGALLAENQSQTEDGVAIAAFTPDCAMINHNNMWNFFSNVASERMRLMLERMPETYGAIAEKSPPLARERYPEYHYARARDEIKDISRHLDEARRDAAAGRENALWEKEW